MNVLSPGCRGLPPYFRVQQYEGEGDMFTTANKLKQNVMNVYGVGNIAGRGKDRLYVKKP